MPFQLKWSPKSQRQLRELSKFHQTALLSEAHSQLIHQPDQVTKKRKRLRVNPLATFELRVGDYRVFYNVMAAENEVEIVALGHKDHNELNIEGEEVEL